ncbi:MAG: toxin-antitoxin system YwqK family antitoxin, partial [Candidatus Kapaibacterium sp.]
MKYAILFLFFLSACRFSTEDSQSIDSLSSGVVGDSTISPNDSSNGDSISPLVDPFEEIFTYEHQGSGTYSTSYTSLDTFFNLDRSIWKIGNYRSGRKDGEWVEYDMEGKLYARRYYTNGVPSGVWKFYNHQGKVIRSEEQSDTLYCIYTFPMGDYSPVVIVAAKNGSIDQVQTTDDEIERAVAGDDSVTRLLPRGIPFTGILIQYDVPNWRWEGIISLKEGRLHGEKMHADNSVESYYDDSLDGKGQGYLDLRFSFLYEEGYYRNDKKVGTWNYYDWYDSIPRDRSTSPVWPVAKIIYDEGKIQFTQFFDE